MNAFSAPVFDLEAHPVLALTLTDREDRLPSAWTTRSAQALRAAAAELTHRLGGRAPTTRP